MNKAVLHADREYALSAVDERVFSSFIEHMGRAVYQGIYEPDHPEADENGFRKDVLDYIRPLNIPLVRYPGGNFLSGLNWKDTIGPKAQRPRRLDLAWRTTETNQFGMDEFIDWCKLAGTKMLGAVNLGTGTAREAGELVEYCNHDSGSYWSDLRIANGHREPHNIKTWCIGNEMSGPWQICHMSPEAYGEKAREAAKIMKWVDPSIEMIACGSAGSDLPSYPSWDRIVLEATYDQVDYLSLHKYYRVGRLSDKDLMASFMDLDQFFHQVESTCDYVKAHKRSSKTMMLSFDEWNVAGTEYALQGNGWETAPHIGEMTYTLRDALAFAGMGMTILNHADRVKIACQAQLVNVIAPIMTQKGGKAVRQTIYYPYLLLSRYGRGEVIRSVTHAPLHETRYGDTPQIYASVIRQEEAGKVCVLVINIDEEAPVQLETELLGFGDLRLSQHICYDGPIHAANTFEAPDAVLPHELPVSASEAPVLPALSFNVLVYDAVKGE